MYKSIISIYLNWLEKSMPKTYISDSQLKTKKIAADLAKELLLKKGKTIILGLEGDIGGGKTTFLQGFARGLGVKEKILSPTFVIMRRFKINDLRFNNFYHLDCYRLKDQKEILDLGFKKIIKDRRNIVAIEWADIVKKAMPRKTIWIKFNVLAGKKRKISILK